MDSSLHTTRYPGIRAFERAETGQFFGRSRETAELFSMVKVKPLTVLFAKSGIGKTSLINAGLTPLLEQNDYFPIKIRLQDTNLSPVETVKKVLAPYLDKDQLNRFGQAPFSLWEYLRSCRFEDSSGATQIPVLIFDQFEELFNHAAATQEALTLALADLVNERLPDAVQTRFRSFARGDRNDELLEWFSPQRVRIVFAIRTDRIGELDRLKYHIPTVLNDRFYLKPLDHVAARDAIVQPAALSGKQFFTKPFEYKEDALQTMLQGLENDSQEVESFQLQILCQQIEKIVAERGLEQVVPADFGGAKGINDILNDYYEREIEKLPANEQVTARRFIEEGLIVNGRRVGMPEGAEQAQFSVDEGLLNKLLESRLIRAETIHLGKIYELSHDTLVEPVLRSYEQRRVVEERAQAAKILAEERAQLRKITQKRQRARLYAIAGFTLAALALVGGFFALRNYLKAEDARQSATVSALAAKAWEVYRDDHTLALRLAEAALRQDSTNTDARQTLRGIANTSTTTFYQSVFTGHGFEIEGLAFSPDGALIASGSFDKTVAIWRRDGTLVTRLDAAWQTDEASGHSATVRSVVFTPDGQAVWSAAMDGWVKKIDLEGKVVGGFRAHKKQVWDMALSPDGSWLVTASNDSTAVIWQADGTKRQVLKGHRDAVWTADISPNGQWIITGSIDGTARLWTSAGRLQYVFDLGGAKVNAVAFSPDSRHVLLGCGDNTAKLFTREGRLEAIYSGHAAEITEVAFASEGTQVLTASNDHSVKLWKRSGAEMLRLVGHTERVGALAVSPDGEWVATGSFDFTAKVWNIPFNLNNKAAHHSAPVTKVAVSPDGQFVLSSSEDNRVKVWSPSGKLLHDLHGHRKEVAQVGFSPFGDRFFSVSPDATICIWDTSGVLHKKLNTFPSNVYTADFSPTNKGRLLAASGSELFLFDSMGREQGRWKAHAGNIARVQFAPDGKSLLSAGRDGKVKIWTTEGVLLDSLLSEFAFSWGSFAPDGKQIATVAYGLMAVEEWGIPDTMPKQYLGHLSENYFVAYSPDGNYIVSCGWDKTARIWDRKTGNTVQVLLHPDGVNGAAFTPDGKTLFTACRDKYVRRWDVATGTLQTVFGDSPDPSSLLESAYIAPLEDIPFPFERYGIAPDMAALIYGEKPEYICSMGQRYLEMANAHLHDLDAGASQLSTAQNFFARARGLDSESKHQFYDSLSAEVYLVEANLYLSHRKFPEMLNAAQKGLQYHVIPMLKVYETFGLLLNNQFKQAKALALKLGRDTTTVVPPYYTNYLQVLDDEMYYYQTQMGIEHPDFERLKEILKQKEE